MRSSNWRLARPIRRRTNRRKTSAAASLSPDRRLDITRAKEESVVIGWLVVIEGRVENFDSPKFQVNIDFGQSLIFLEEKSPVRVLFLPVFLITLADDLIEASPGRGDRTTALTKGYT
jgi:hypothetical protein